MEFFANAKTVRLKSWHGKYMWADEDAYRVYQCKEPMNILAQWRVELDPEGRLIRLKSCHDCYLTASDESFLTGMTGKKVVQTKPKHIDSSVEWEPIKDGSKVKLKTCHGNYLRANKALGPPWRNSITHDLPTRMQKHQDYLLWEIEVVWDSKMSGNGFGSSHGGNRLNTGHTAYVSSPSIVSPPPRVPSPTLSTSGHSPSQSFGSSRHSPPRSHSISSHTSSHPADPVHPPSQPVHSPSESSRPHSQPVQPPSHSAHSAYVPSALVASNSISSPHSKPPKERHIFYAVANDLDEAKRLDDSEVPSFIFKGHTFTALKKQLREVTGIDEDILVYSRMKASTNLYQLKLPTLPPNNADMHVVVVKTGMPLNRSMSGADES